MWYYMCIRWLINWSEETYDLKESSWNSDTSTLKPNRPQHDRPVPCAIAQQYSSTISVTPRFNLRIPREKSACLSKVLLLQGADFVFNFVTLTLRNLQLRNSASDSIYSQLLKALITKTSFDYTYSRTYCLACKNKFDIK